MGYFDGPDEVDGIKKSGGSFERLGETVGKAVAGRQRSYEESARRSSGLSDEKLIREYKNERNFARKKAMENELKSRGMAEMNRIIMQRRENHAKRDETF